MTRQQVAKRLGKSLATLRRLEGVRLHAVQDARGVHRFDPDEVETLVRDIDNGEVGLWQEPVASPGEPRDFTGRPVPVVLSWNGSSKPASAKAQGCVQAINGRDAS